jgi:hypothetical protein
MVLFAVSARCRNIWSGPEDRHCNCKRIGNGALCDFLAGVMGRDSEGRLKRFGERSRGDR